MCVCVCVCVLAVVVSVVSKEWAGRWWVHGVTAPVGAAAGPDRLPE